MKFSTKQSNKVHITITKNNHFTTNFFLLLLIILLVMSDNNNVQVVEGTWCVARSDASDEALQLGLNYACATGADCTPLQETGLCFLPNTLQAHASYAYNSFYQRKSMAPGACDFSATATIAKTDPSYGSCVYPASPSTAGIITSTSGGATPRSPYGTTPPFGNTSPLTPTTTSSGTFGGGSGFNPTMGPPIPTTSGSAPSENYAVATGILLEMLILLVSSFAVV